MARKPRLCPAGLHHLSPDTRTCLTCEGDAALAYVTGVVVALEPALDVCVISDAVSAAGRSVDQLRRLRAHLEGDATALTSGGSNVPTVVTRLAHELAGRGAVGVVLPKCADCGGARPLLNVVEGGRICNSCRRIRRAEVCSHCAKTRPVGGRGPDRAAICANCWRRDPANAAMCKVCETPRPVSVRDAEGRATCIRCYRAPLRQCGSCGELGRVVSRLSGIPLCVGCYAYPARACGRCGRVRPIARRARDGDPDLCDGCTQPPLATCTLCGTHRRCHFVAEGRPICLACSPVRTLACSHCGDVRTVTAQWPEGPVCPRCYTNALRRRGECASCGQPRRLIDPPGPRAKRCATCAGVAVGPVCGRCGIEDKLYERGLCPRCVLSDRANDLLAGDDGTVPAPLVPVYEAIVGSPSAVHALGWLRRGKSASLLVDLVKTGTPPTHEMLDALPPTKSVPYVRQLLVASGALPEHPSRLGELERWIAAAVLTTENEADRRLLRAYARWALLARVRRHIRGGDISAGQTTAARQRFKAAQRFLLWLERRGTTANGCGQAEIDCWLSGGARLQFDIREFVMWAVGAGAMSEVEAPARPWRQGTGLDEDERWAVVRRLLHDDSIDIVDRVGGLFVLLFAQHLTTLTRLTVDDVVVEQDQVSVRFGRDPAELPDPLGELVLRLCSERSGRSVGSPSTNWLFRGQRPGQPMSAS